MIKKLFLRHSRVEDTQAVLDFYAQNPHGYVYQRAADILRERVESGAVTLIEDEQGKIVAAAIAYPLVVEDAEGRDRHMWSEIGSVRVALGDVGLFKPLLSALVLRAWLFEPPEDRFAIEIAKNNSHSKHVFAKEGATPFAIPPILEKKVAGTLQPGVQSLNVDWFQMGVETMPTMACHLLENLHNPLLVNKKTGERYELDFSRCVLTGMFRDAIEKIAAADYGDASKPDPRVGLRAARNRL